MKTCYKHVVFDLDGTVYNTEKAYMESLYCIVKKLMPNTKENVKTLSRFMGTAIPDIQKELGLDDDTFKTLCEEWIDGVTRYQDTIRPFDGIISVIALLKERVIHLGIVTSRDYRFTSKLGAVVSPLPVELTPYIKISISADKVENPKPAPDSLLKYMEMTGAKREEILYIGDTYNDYLCALNCGIDFGLAVWGTNLNKSVNCTHHFLNPWDIISAVFSYDSLNYRFYRWAKEIQAIGQIGLAFSTNVFDIERFNRLREISAEILSTMTEAPIEKVRDAILTDRGYITPKIDTRAAVFNENDEILLVKEAKNGKWSLPGGWCDESENIRSNTIKEVREEAGMAVNCVKFVGMLDKDKWNRSSQPFHILMALTICRYGDGQFVPNDETLERRFFKLEDIPVDELRVGTTTIEQIRLCFEALHTENWVPVID